MKLPIRQVHQDMLITTGTPVAPQCLHGPIRNLEVIQSWLPPQTYKYWDILVIRVAVRRNNSSIWSNPIEDILQIADFEKTFLCLTRQREYVTKIILDLSLGLLTRFNMSSKIGLEEFLIKLDEAKEWTTIPRSYFDALDFCQSSDPTYRRATFSPDQEVAIILFDFLSTRYGDVL